MESYSPSRFLLSIKYTIGKGNSSSREEVIFNFKYNG